MKTRIKNPPNQTAVLIQIQQQQTTEQEKDILHLEKLPNVYN